MTDVELITYHATQRSTWFFVRIRTDEGVEGIGECSDPKVPSQVPDEIDWIRSRLVGRTPTEAGPEVLDELIRHRDRRHDSARQLCTSTVVGALDLALSDIAAQVAGLPLAEWLRAQAGDINHNPDHTTVPLYANINRAARVTGASFADLALRAVADGFRTVKLAPFDDAGRGPAQAAAKGLEELRTVRAAVGEGVTLLVDLHHQLPEPILHSVLDDLSDLSVGWLEDAVDVRDPDAMSRLAAHTEIPLAGGELFFDRGDLKAALATGALSFLLLDPKHAGGPTAIQRLLHEHAPDTQVTLHNPTGPVATAACAHLAAAGLGVQLVEYSYGEPVNRSAVTRPAEHIATTDHGPSLTIPPGAGLGLHLLL